MRRAIQWFPSSVLPKRVREEFPQVTRVADAHKPLTIELKGSDLSRSKIKSPSECALAKACARQEQADAAVVQIRHAYIIKGNTALRYSVPESVRREITAFDRMGDFRPGVYQLGVIIPSKRLGVVPKHSHKATKGSRAPYHIFRHHTVGIR